MAGYKKNLNAALEHLESGESIKASIGGTYDCKIMGEDSVRSGIFAATEKRVIFFAKKLMGYDMESFPFQNISSIEKSKNFLGHKISFFASGNKVEVKWIQDGDVEGFINYVNTKIGTGTQTSNTMATSSNDDIPTMIKKLAELKDQGILTEQEFLQKKRELLSKM